MGRDPTPDPLASRSHEELCALLDGISGRVRAALAGSPSDEELAALGRDVALVARFVVAVDPYQRPDRYVFASSAVGAPHFASFLAALFARFPERRAGDLASLAAYHASRHGLAR